MPGDKTVGEHRELIAWQGAFAPGAMHRDSKYGTIMDITEIRDEEKFGGHDT